MNDKHPDTYSLIERIDRQPGLREQIEKLVSIMEAKSGTPDNINAIEELIIEEGQRLQKSVLQNWANNKQQIISEAADRKASLRQSSKKK